jgi:hypothetical protein
MGDAVEEEALESLLSEPLGRSFETLRETRGRLGQSITSHINSAFPIVDPLAGSLIFLAMTQDYSPQTRRVLAWRVAVAACELRMRPGWSRRALTQKTCRARCGTREYQPRWTSMRSLCRRHTGAPGKDVGHGRGAHVRADCADKYFSVAAIANGELGCWKLFWSQLEPNRGGTTS